MFNKQKINKKRYISKLSSYTLASILLLAASLAYSNDNFSGNWGGLRENLSNKGIDFELVYSGEVYSNIQGGIDQKTIYHDNYDLIATIDTEALYGLKGGMFNIYFLGNSGDSPSENIGDLQVASNIDTDEAWKLYEAWYQQNMFDDKLSILVGLFDLNSEFDATETAGLFLNSSHGIGPDYSQSGVNGPSIFPTTSLAFRGQVQVTDNVLVRAAVFDGIPGDPEKASGTHILYESDEDGLLTAGEINYLNSEDEERFYKFSLGTWMYSAEFEKIEDPSETGTGNFGFYAMAESQLYQEDENQGLAAFARFGMANTDYNPIGNYIGFGTVYTGLLPGRDDDQVGLAVAIANNGDKFKDSEEQAGGEVEDAETNIEFAYNAGLLPWLNIQADLQYIINPGTDPDLDNAFAGGIRFSVSF